jgi:gas vesicle protein
MITFLKNAWNGTPSTPAALPKKSLSDILGAFEQVKTDLVKFQEDNRKEAEEAQLYIAQMKNEIAETEKELVALAAETNRASSIHSKISDLLS